MESQVNGALKPGLERKKMGAWPKHDTEMRSVAGVLRAYFAPLSVHIGTESVRSASVEQSNLV